MHEEGMLESITMFLPTGRSMNTQPTGSRCEAAPARGKTCVSALAAAAAGAIILVSCLIDAEDAGAKNAEAVWHAYKPAARASMLSITLIFPFLLLSLLVPL